MERDGIEPNLIMLNVLINAFGNAGRYMDALSVYEHIKESVCLLSIKPHYTSYFEAIYANRDVKFS